MGRYAENTSVSVAKSKAEIEDVVTRYGANRFASMTERDKAVIVFEVHGYRVQFVLPLPDKEDFRSYEKKGPYGSKRTVRRDDDQMTKEWEQACRQKWRALTLAVKAKLEAVESGITNFQDEFLAHIVLPDGKTVGKWFNPQLKAAYETGKMPLMLTSGKE